MKALDLFCGLGGWSKGLVSQGFEVTGVDIVDVGYPYNLVISSVENLAGSDYAGYDVIVGSPPCRDFSRLATVGKVRWVDPPNITKGLVLVRAFLRFIQDAKPRIWLLENTYRLAPILEANSGLKPRMVVYLARGMKRAFWGDFPLFLVPFDSTRPNTEDIVGKYRSWLRAEIPFSVANSFACAARQYLTNKE